jgi:FKBP-type peptidyl-prolyl cis-trans isomerase
MKIKKITLSILVLGVLVLALAGCDPARKYEKEEKQQIQDYLSGLGDTVYVTKPSGLVYINLVAGTGRLPIVKDTVSIYYKGMYITGRTFATNVGDAEPLEFIVGSGYLIEGLDEGIRYIKDGGKAKLMTPSSIAYGPNGYGIISGFTPLLWEIQVVEVKAGSK